MDSWKTLPFDYEIAPTFSLAAVLYMGEICVFGGPSNGSKRLHSMFIFTEAGELVRDLSDDPLIPRDMSLDR